MGQPSLLRPQKTVCVAEDPERFALRLVDSFEIGKEVVFSDPSVFVADCRGDAEPEIIIAEKAYLRICSLSGEVLLDIRLPHPKLVPAFTADTDCDGKADIVFGSENSVRNEITVINGTGVVVSRFTEDRSVQDFKSITPQGIIDGRLYAIARPSDFESPRGIICLDAFSLNPAWIFYCPDPLSLTPIRHDMFILSYKIDHNGVFKSYGDLKFPTADGPNYCVQGMMLKITPDGEPAGEIRVLDGDGGGLDMLEYYALPGDDNTVLLVNYVPDEDPSIRQYRLYKVRISDGKITAESGSISERYLEKRIIPCGGSFIIAVSSVEDRIPVLRFFNSDLQEIKRIPCGASLRFGPVLSGSSGFRFFLVQDNGLYSVNQNLELKSELPGADCLQVLYFNYKNDMLLLYKQNSIEIYSLIALSVIQ